MSTDTFEAYFDVAERLGFEFRCSESNRRLVVTPNDPISNKKFFYLKKGDTAYYALIPTEQRVDRQPRSRGVQGFASQRN